MSAVRSILLCPPAENENVNNSGQRRLRPWLTDWNDAVVCFPVCLHHLQQGGMKAVIWTDVFQIVVMLSGFVAIFIYGTILVGGPALVLEIANNASRVNFNE